MLGQVPAGKDAAVHFRVQGFHAPVEHLGKARDLGDVLHPEARLPEQLRGPAGREDLHPQGGEPLGEVNDAGLVVNADERAMDSAHVVSLMWTRRPSMRSRPSANSRMAS